MRYHLNDRYAFSVRQFSSICIANMIEN